MNKKVLLMILDGWGEGRQDNSNVIYAQGAPFIESLRQKYPMSHLQASGEFVGLPDGQMGNSEVGHMNLGAGRTVYQDLVKINMSCRDHSMMQNPEIKAAYDYVKASGKKLHLMGLTSTGGVHSSLTHVYEFLAEAQKAGLDGRVFVHCFMDGRDTDPRSGKGFLQDLEAEMAKTTGKIASVCGRFYAMDRDKRWNRVKEAYDLLVEGKGAAFESAIDGIQASYDADVTDEFVKPIVITENGKPLATIEEGDAVIFYNFRNDRAREITAALTQKDMPEEGMHTIPLYFCCLTPYDASFTGLHILFDKEIVKDTLGETVSKAGRKQLRIAETEKYAHVTFFFNGGGEQPFENESRILVNSPKVPTYDMKPEMSALEVTDKLLDAIRTEEQDMIILNFANGDMIGHTGVYDAIRCAVACIDGCVQAVVTAAIAHGYTILITADHGNADYAVNDDGTPNTAHSLNPVQFIVVNAGDEVKEVKDGALCNVAPTILKLMGIPQPASMTAEPLI